MASRSTWTCLRLTQTSPHLAAPCAALLLVLSPGLRAQDASTATVPLWLPGDQWQYQVHSPISGKSWVTTTVVTARDEDGTITLDRTAGASPTTQDKRNRDLNPLVLGTFRFEPCQPLYDFPLTVGKTWSARFQGFNGPGASPVDHDLSATVTGIEAVEVPAGQFTAYRVAVADQVRPHVMDFPGGIAYAWRTTMTYWYAPAVKSTVKVESATIIQSGAPADAYTMMLQSYRPASEVKKQ